MFGVALCLAAGLVTAGQSSSQLDTGGPLLSAKAFADSVGVNTHLPYTDSRYADANRVIADLAYLGVRRVRDWSPNPTGQGQQSYENAATAGEQFDMLFRDWDVARGLTSLKSFKTRHPAAVAAIEGPNEVNNEPVEYAGLKGAAAAVRLQEALYQGAKADPALRALPVFNVTSWPDIKAAADYANFHAYAHHGRQPQEDLANGLAEQKAVEPTPSFVVTESGYATLSGDPDGVSERAQARLILNTVFDAARLGAKQIYVYELLDAYADPTGRDKEKHFGLFRFDGSAKPAAVTIHNLEAVLKQVGDGPAATGERPRFVGVPPDARSLTLTGADGAMVVAIWREPPLWDGSRQQDLQPPSVPVSVRASVAVEVYDPVLSDRPITGAPAGQAASFSLIDHVLLVRTRALTRAAVPDRSSRDRGASADVKATSYSPRPAPFAAVTPLARDGV